MAQKNEIIVGRQGEFTVDEQSVSRQHARICRIDGKVFIEDMDSANGTFVNGKRIVKKQVTMDDAIKLGEGYVLDLGAILARIPLSNKEFETAFIDLQSIYDKYVINKAKLQGSSSGQIMLMRALPTAIVMLVCGRMLMRSNADLSTIIVASAIGIVLIVGGLLLAKKTQEKTPLKLSELEERFKVDYCCPACKKSFGAMNSWESLKNQGKCPFCKRKFGA